MDRHGRSNQMTTGELPSLTDFAQDRNSSWPSGWYPATVVEEYSTRSGKTFTTSDEPSRDGSSRNLRLCLEVRSAAGQDRVIQTIFHYRPMDFTPERFAQVTQARRRFNGVRGRWSDTDIQRSSLALAKLGMLENAAGSRLKRTKAGTLDPEAFIGTDFDVYLDIDEQGYNEAREFAAAGTKTHNSAGKSQTQRHVGT